MKKVNKSLSIIIFEESCACWMLLIFILIKFCKIFCCLRLYITRGYRVIDQLVFSIAAIPGLTRSWKIKFKVQV